MRNISKDPSCKSAIGIDGSSDMEEKAKRLSAKSNYYFTDLMDWKPEQKVNVVHSMEVYSYVAKPELLIQNI